MTIWYDFTTTRRNRSRNGIAKVEWSIGAALLERRPYDVRAFALDERDGLVELDPHVHLTGAVYAGEGTITSSLPDPDHPGIAGAVRSMLVVLLGEHAPALRSAVVSALAQLRRARARSIAWGRRMLPPKRSAPRLQDLVTEGDVVISMGADWSGELARSLGDLRRTRRCTIVTMVYDLIPLTHTHLAFHKDRELFSSYYHTLVSNSDVITCISAQSRRDLLEFVDEQGLVAPPTWVLRLGDGERAPSRKHLTRAEFFLVVGTVERRKNLELLFDALRILESNNEQLPTVVVAGAVGWGVADLLDELRLGATPASRSIVLLGEVGDDLIEHLYTRARALLFPSHYEGWGLPLREAAVHGCPVAAGDCPAAREALDGYAGATVLPTDDAAPWADYLTSVPAPEQPADFHPWSATAEQLEAIVTRQSVLGSRGSAGR